MVLLSTKAEVGLVVVGSEILLELVSSAQKFIKVRSALAEFFNSARPANSNGRANRRIKKFRCELTKKEEGGEFIVEDFGTKHTENLYFRQVPILNSVRV